MSGLFVFSAFLFGDNEISKNVKLGGAMCTSIRFTDNSGHMYLGRNLDWSFDYGQQVRVMPRGFHIPYSFIDDATAAHAVIGMCIDYRNYPMFFDCGNDAGLAWRVSISRVMPSMPRTLSTARPISRPMSSPCGWQRRSRRSMRSRPRCATRVIVAKSGRRGGWACRCSIGLSATASAASWSR